MTHLAQFATPANNGQGRAFWKDPQPIALYGVIIDPGKVWAKRIHSGRLATPSGPAASARGRSR